MFYQYENAESEALTRGILKASKGNVLIIDEAYGLLASSGASSTGAGNTPVQIPHIFDSSFLNV